MSVVITPITGRLRGRGFRNRLRDPLDPDDVAAIHEGMSRHAVLVFRDQPLTDEQQLAFSRQFWRT